jgi:hypothetical protein
VRQGTQVALVVTVEFLACWYRKLPGEDIMCQMRMVLAIIMCHVALYGCSPLASAKEHVSSGCSSAAEKEQVSSLVVDMNDDGCSEAVVLRELHDSVVLHVFFGPTFEYSLSARFQLDEPDRQDAFCGRNIEMTAVYLPNAADKRAGRVPAIRLSDGRCDAFYIKWHQPTSGLRWSRI